MDLNRPLAEPYTPLRPLPDRPIYRAAEAYSHIYPYSNAVMTALTTPGDRLTKLDAGTDDLAYWLGFQAFAKLYDKGLKKLYDTNPDFANWANAHPILTAIPVTAVGTAISMFGGDVAKMGKRILQDAGQSALEQRPELKSRLTKPLLAVVDSKPASWLGRHVWQPVEKAVNSRAFQKITTIAGLAIVGTLLARLVYDLGAFGKAYRKARREAQHDLSRQEFKHLSPQALGQQVLVKRYYPAFQQVPAYQIDFSPSQPRLLETV